MKGPGVIAIAALIALAAWVATRGKAGEASLGKAPVSESPAGARPELIVEKPPGDVITYELGGTRYAKFEQPIEVGGGFKQWGVTKDGYPVLSMNPPETYNPTEWY